MNRVIRQFRSKFPFALRCLSVLVSLAAISCAREARAQYFPTFGSATLSTCPACAGVSIATAPDTVNPTAIFAAVNSGNYLQWGYSRDGLNYSINSQFKTQYVVHCDAVPHTANCSPSIAYFNGALYISFRDYNNMLEILKGVPNTDPGTKASLPYVFTHIETLNVGGISTAPSMGVFNGKLYIIYGIDIPNYHNALSETYTSDGASWTTTDSGLGAVTYCAFTPVGLSVLNGVFYMAAEQDNSSRHFFYFKSTDGLTWNLNEDSAIYTDSGISMVTYNSNLVLATKQDNSQDHVYLFSSPNGSTWYDEQLPNSGIMLAGTSPALTLYNGGVALAFEDSNGYIEGAVATH